MHRLHVHVGDISSLFVASMVPRVTVTSSSVLCVHYVTRLKNKQLRLEYLISIANSLTLQCQQMVLQIATQP